MYSTLKPAAPGKLGLVLWLCLMGGCQHSVDTTPPGDVQTTNAVRKRIGVREILPSWSFYLREFGCEKWKHGDRLCKIVQRTHHESESEEKEYPDIVWEEDYYYGPGKLNDPDGDYMDEQVIVHFEYGQSRFFLSYAGENPRLISLIHGLTPVHESGYAGQSNKDTLAVADEMLKEFGLTRLE